MEKTCKNCGTPITKEYCEDNYPEVCEHWKPKKPKTNADRIRAMSDEELAEFLESTHTNMAIKLGGEYIVRKKEYIGIWLKQHAE